MADRRRFGDSIPHSIGLTDAPIVTAHTLQKSQIGMAHVRCGPDSLGMTQRIPAEDTYIAAVYLTDLKHHELWSRGKRVLSRPYAANSMRIVNLEAEFSALIAHEHEAVAFHIPRDVLNEFAMETGERIGHLTCPPGMEDPVVSSLTHALLPVFGRPDDFSSLFVDHLTIALLSHLASRYGGMQLRRMHGSRGQLSLSQERTAKEFMAANACGEISLIDIAQACGLSRSHFIGAFSRTTGLTPHKWLQTYRLQKARTMLLESSHSIAEIAAMCGFADQSHMTRKFTRSVGSSPGAWRRAHRKDSSLMRHASYLSG